MRPSVVLKRRPGSFLSGSSQGSPDRTGERHSVGRVLPHRQNLDLLNRRITSRTKSDCSQAAAEPIRRMMSYTSDARRPFTLWFETLPSNDTARLLISSHLDQVDARLYWNQRFHTKRSFATLDAAKAWGYELHQVLIQDALAGALLGYDSEVLAQLQARCSAPETPHLTETE